MIKATSDYYDVEIDKERWLITSFTELVRFIDLDSKGRKGIKLCNLSVTAFNVFSNETEANKKKMLTSKLLKSILPRRTDMMKG